MENAAIQGVIYPKITPALIQDTLEHNGGSIRSYVLDALFNYGVRTKMRRGPVLCLLGHGQAGKDEAAAFIGERLGIQYGGSTSSIAAPIVAGALGTTTEEAFRRRHEQREFWFHFLNAFRQFIGDYSVLAKMLLAQSDIAVGLRSGEEVKACVEHGVVDLTIWIDNPRVEPDPTVEFTQADCDITIVNAGTLAEYHQRLARIVDKLAPLWA